jgi:hypothetical protein
MFANNSFSLERLSSICSLLDMDFVDLLRVFDEQQEKITHLTESQEQELVSDAKFLLVAVCVQNTWTFEDIVSYYNISDVECISYLARLDRLGIIQLLPNNRIRRMVAQDFQWLPNGPIELFFEREIKTKFLESTFSGTGEQHGYLTGSLSEKSISIINKKLDMLISEFSALQNDDAKLAITSRRNIGFMYAIRPWQSSTFQQFKRIQSE